MDDTSKDAGSVAGQHPIALGSYPVALNPRGESRNVIAAPFARAVACWATRRWFFEFDSSVVLPQIAPELRRLEARVQANPEALASIFGHADPSGSDDYNKPLSGRRARAFFALLTRNVEIWESLYGSPTSGDSWGLKSTQSMLAFLVDETGVPYYRGTPDNRYGTLTDQAVRAFQRDNGLTVDGNPGPQTRKALYRAYMDAICVDPGHPFVMTPEQFVGDPAENATGDGKGAYQGCGEFNPILVFSEEEDARLKRPENKAERDQLNACNRRLMVLFFGKDTFYYRTPTEVAQAWPCPKWNEGAAACQQHFWVDGDQRRAPGPVERRYEVDHDTMACEWYDQHVRLSPCEGTTPPQYEAQNLVLEWPEQMTPHLPAGLRLELTAGTVTLSIPWEEGEVSGDLRRFVFENVPEGQASTLFARTDQNELRLWQDQFANKPDDPPTWEHWLEEWLVEAPE